MRRSRAFGAIALIAGAAVALAGCSGTSSDNGSGAANNSYTADPNQLAVNSPFTRPKVPQSGTVRVAVDEAYTNYNNNLSSTNDIANAYINGLIQLQPFFVNDVKNVTKVQMDADLMSSVKLVSTAPQVVEFDFNPKAVWQDGAPVNCDDIYLQWLASYNQSGDWSTAFSQLLPGWDHVSSVKCSGTDNKTATLTFSKTWADWTGLVQNLQPAHVLEKAVGITSAQLTALSPVNPPASAKDTLTKIANFWSGGPNADQPGFIGVNLTNDLSNGPYMIKSADSKSLTVLVRNPKWWGNPAGPAEIDVRVNTDDQSAFQQLQNKEINVAAGQPNAQVAQEVNATGGQYKLITGLSFTYEHLDYQFSNPVFKKYPELRKALSMCVNRSDVIGKVVADVDPAIKPLGSVLFGQTESAYKDDYANTGMGNEAAAKKILTDAGWTMGPNGFLQKDGQTASITIGHKTNDRRNNTVIAIQGECQQAGIQINNYSSDGFNGKDLPAGNYQVALFAWTGSPYKSGLSNIYESPSAGGSQNFQNYSNPQVDTILHDADGQLDYNKRVTELQQANKLIAADDATLPLFSLPEYAVTDGTWTSTEQNGNKVGIQDNEASSGVLFDAFAWQPTS